MVTFLIVFNIILIFLNILILLKQKNFDREKNNVNFEELNLIEFQNNLKDLIAELNKISESNIEKLDNKIKSVEKLNSNIDEKIQKITYLIERAELIRKELDIKKSKEFIDKEIIESKKEKKLSKKTAEDKEIKKTVADKFIIDNSTKPKKMNQKEKYKHIIALLNQGLSIEEISKTTGLTKGEIELIKNLKK